MLFRCALARRSRLRREFAAGQQPFLQLEGDKNYLGWRVGLLWGGVLLGLLLFFLFHLFHDASIWPDKNFLRTNQLFVGIIAAAGAVVNSPGA